MAIFLMIIGALLGVAFVLKFLQSVLCPSDRKNYKKESNNSLDHLSNAEYMALLNE